MNRLIKSLTVALVLSISPSFACGELPVIKKSGVGFVLYKITHIRGKRLVVVRNENRTNRIQKRKREEEHITSSAF